MRNKSEDYRLPFPKTKYRDQLLTLSDLEIRENITGLLPLQRFTYYDIAIIADGNGTFNIDGYDQDLKQCSVFFSSPGQIRKWNTQKVSKN